MNDILESLNYFVA